MAAVVWWREQNRRILRRNRIFRDRNNPLDVWNNDQVIKRFRLPRHVIFELVGELQDAIDFPVARKGALTASLQLCLALRFYATGLAQTDAGDMIGVDQSTTSRTVKHITDALYAKRGSTSSSPIKVKQTSKNKNSSGRMDFQM